ncbi:MAG TPA: 3-hydroxyacyl-ACP dehydratase FabZ family protein [Terriglobia bacterium]|nr:3-hydroxyacyl-ACP dehydratase FabZ family protein [Terriglobia bacterium]
MHLPEVRRTIPHRYPFLLVDRITEFMPGKRIAATKHFGVNDRGSQGFLPGAPIIPPGIVLEMVTQVGAVLVLERPEMSGKVAMILQIPSAKILTLVEPGDTVRVEAEVLKMGPLVGELRGAAYRAGVLIAEGQMRFAIANAADVLPR